MTAPPPPRPPTPAPAAPSAPGAPPEEADLRKLFEVWVDSDLKAQLVVFYNNNPGVVETPEGLARRLGTSLEAIRGTLDDHIRLGLLRERRLGEKTVLMFDRERRAAMQSMIVDSIRRRTEALQ